MHTKFCEHGDGQDDFTREQWRAWWPEGQPAEIDVSALSATANNLANPTRLAPINGAGRWLAIWGNFAGLRIGFNPSETFQAMSPCIVPYPEGVDLYLSKDTGGAGIMSLARFQSRAAAIAFCGSRPSSTAKIPPGVSAFTPADATANPAGTLSGAEVFNMGFNGTTWDRLRSLALNADNITFPTLGAFLAAAQGLVVNDRTTSLDRMRQPDALAESLVVGSGISTATTGVKLSKTFGAGVNGRCTWVSLYGGATATAVLQLELVRAATTYIINRLTTAVGNPNFPLGEAGPIPLLAGDTLQLNCTTAIGGSTADMFIGTMQTRYVI